MKPSVLCIAICGIVSQAFASQTLRIMPLGDSITYGQGWNGGGYRAVLREKLVAAGYSIDYVGTQTANPGSLSASGDVQHEGHPGWKIAQLTKSFGTWSAEIDAPHVVLLKIGTNNCNNDHDVAMRETRELLAEIRRVQPSAHIVVGTIAPFLNGTALGNNNVWVEEHNARLRAEVASRVADGERISLADLYPVISPTTGMNDDRHPNEEGYRAMAQVWFDAIRAAFPDPAADRAEPRLAIAKFTVDETAASATAIFNGAVAPASVAAGDFECAGLSWKSCTVSADARSVTLVADGGFAPGFAYTIAVSGISSASGATSVAERSFDVLYQPSGAENYVPEAKQYRKVYRFDIPMANFRADVEDPDYAVDEHEDVKAFSRIAYYVELRDSNDALSYIWVSMDAFTDDASKIALPTAKSGAVFQQYVTNVKVWSNVPTVTPGEKERGNIEFWPSNYGGNPKLGVPGATSAFDVDDTRDVNGNFGCMQIHDTAALVPLFCYNNWGGKGGNCNLGIGPNTGGGNIDWTQVGSGQDWPNQRMLEVYVLEAKEPEYPPAPAAVVERVPSAAGYSLLYQIDIQPNMCISTNGAAGYAVAVDAAAYVAAHDVDNSAKAPRLYSRVGYMLELVDKSDNVKWAWTSFDAFSQDFGDVDIPTANPNHPVGGYLNARAVQNLEVFSNVDGIATGRRMASGVIEFSPWNYNGNNARNVANATDSCDFGDNLFTRVGNYGCMQVGNAAAAQVVWSITKFNGRGVGIGIGNSTTGGDNTDYTFETNAGNYKSRTLYVLVKPTRGLSLVLM